MLGADCPPWIVWSGGLALSCALVQSLAGTGSRLALYRGSTDPLRLFGYAFYHRDFSHFGGNLFMQCSLAQSVESGWILALLVLAGHVVASASVVTLYPEGYAVVGASGMSWALIGSIAVGVCHSGVPLLQDPWLLVGPVVAATAVVREILRLASIVRGHAHPEVIVHLGGLTGGLLVSLTSLLGRA